MTFAIVGDLKTSRSDLEHKVERLGGAVVAKIDKSTTACVSTKGILMVYCCRYVNGIISAKTNIKKCQKPKLLID